MVQKKLVLDGFKSDVRLVIHDNLPMPPIDYYQRQDGQSKMKSGPGVYWKQFTSIP